MRLHRLLLAPLTAIAALCVASPSLAADFTVDVTNYKFTAKTQTIGVGDKVVWTFTDEGHTTTSRPGQIDSWDSKVEDAGGRFEHTFTKPGRYDYVCTPHESFMSGSIVVGKDTVADTVDAFKTKASGTKATISFKLNEAASMTYKLKGPSKRTVKRKRLAAGKQRFAIKGLKSGRYTGTLTLTDAFHKKTTQKKKFRL